MAISDMILDTIGSFFLISGPYGAREANNLIQFVILFRNGNSPKMTHFRKLRRGC